MPLSITFLPLSLCDAVTLGGQEDLLWGAATGKQGQQLAHRHTRVAR
jgi:hypothetical protein